MSTIQFDFNLPERLDLIYTGADDKSHRPFMLHRALLGSMERFFAIPTEHYGGIFPVWLAPVQVSIIPVADTHFAWADEVASELAKNGFRARIEKLNSTLSYRTREAQNQQMPYMLVIGDKDLESRTVKLRDRSGK